MCVCAAAPLSLYIMILCVCTFKEWAFFFLLSCMCCHTPVLSQTCTATAVLLCTNCVSYWTVLYTIGGAGYNTQQPVYSIQLTESDTVKQDVATLYTTVTCPLYVHVKTFQRSSPFQNNTTYGDQFDLKKRASYKHYKNLFTQSAVHIYSPPSCINWRGQWKSFKIVFA